MKEKCLVKLATGLASVALVLGFVNAPVYATTITLDPAVANANFPLVGTGVGTGNCFAACVTTASGITVDTLFYKADVGDANNPATVESGLFAGNYTTTFANLALDPQDALIEYVSGTSIVCPNCVLEVKDGNQTPGRYFFDLANWDGLMDIQMENFWPGGGAISHVSIWGQDSTVPPGGVIPEPATLLLFGSGLAGLGLWRWKTAKKV